MSSSLPFSRFLETEADQVGLELASKACFDVRGSAKFWSELEADIKAEIAKSNAQKLGDDKKEKERQTHELFSTHPSNETRAESINKLIPKVKEQFFGALKLFIYFILFYFRCF